MPIAACVAVAAASCIQVLSCAWQFARGRFACMHACVRCQQRRGNSVAWRSARARTTTRSGTRARGSLLLRRTPEASAPAQRSKVQCPASWGAMYELIPRASSLPTRFSSNLDWLSGESVASATFTYALCTACRRESMDLNCDWFSDSSARQRTRRYNAQVQFNTTGGWATSNALVSLTVRAGDRCQVTAAGGKCRKQTCLAPDVAPFKACIRHQSLQELQCIATWWHRKEQALTKWGVGKRLGQRNAAEGCSATGCARSDRAHIVRERFASGAQDSKVVVRAQS